MHLMHDVDWPSFWACVAYAAGALVIGILIGSYAALRGENTFNRDTAMEWYRKGWDDGRKAPEGVEALRP